MRKETPGYYTSDMTSAFSCLNYKLKNIINIKCQTRSFLYFLIIFMKIIFNFVTKYFLAFLQKNSSLARELQKFSKL